MKYRQHTLLSLLLICGIALAPTVALAAKGLGKTGGKSAAAKPGGYTGRTGTRIADPSTSRPSAKTGTTKIHPGGASGARTATPPKASNQGQAGKIARPGTAKQHGKPMVPGTRARNNLQTNPGGYTGRAGLRTKSPSTPRGLTNTQRGPSKTAPGHVTRPGQTAKASAVNKGKGPATPSIKSNASSVLTRQPMPMGTKDGKNLNNRGTALGAKHQAKGQNMTRTQNPTQSKLKASTRPNNGMNKSGVSGKRPNTNSSASSLLTRQPTPIGNKNNNAQNNRGQLTNAKGQVTKKPLQATTGKPTHSPTKAPSKLTNNQQKRLGVHGAKPTSPADSRATTEAKLKRFERTNLDPVDPDAISLSPPSSN